MAKLKQCVAITSCPAGAVHTQMATAALEGAAKKLGINIKIESQGAFGIENELSRKDIDEAQIVIFAADIAIADQERFEGKKILKVSTPEAIGSAEKVFNKAQSLLEN